MYKTKLQEFCLQQAWRLPKYSTSKDGPDHKPRFKATVTVNGVAFVTPDQCRSSKEAQNKAAELAFGHFTTTPKPLQSSPDNPPSDALISSYSGFVTGHSTGVTLQPTLEEQIPISLVDETQLVVEGDRKSRGYSISIMDFDTGLSTGAMLQPTTEQEIPIALVDETQSGVKNERKFTGYSSSSINFDIKPSIGVTLQPTIDEATLQPSTQSTTMTLVNQTPLEVKDDEKSTVVQHLYKNQLQIYAQKRNLALPVYSRERQGPPHASRFKSKVTIDGQTYESVGFFPTIKEAEHAAAEVACDSLSLSKVQEDGCALYKSLLQELAREKGFCLPKYDMAVSGPPHMPIFVSTVEIGGQFFQGQEAKNKKQAEMNAAKVAYIANQQEGSASEVPSILYSDCLIREALKVTSSILQSVINTGDSQQNVKPKANLSIHNEQNKEDKDGNQEENSSKLTTVNADAGSHQPPILPPEADINVKRHRYSSSYDIVYDHWQDLSPSTSSSPEDGQFSP